MIWHLFFHQKYNVTPHVPLHLGSTRPCDRSGGDNPHFLIHPRFRRLGINDSMLYIVRYVLSQNVSPRPSVAIGYCVKTVKHTAEIISSPDRTKQDYEIMTGSQLIPVYTVWKSARWFIQLFVLFHFTTVRYLTNLISMSVSHYRDVHGNGKDWDLMGLMRFP